MPMKEKILEEVQALIDLWQKECTEAAELRDMAAGEMIQAAHRMLSGDQQDIKHFDVCILSFDAALKILQDSKRRLQAMVYYSDMLRKTIKTLFDAGEPEEPEDLGEVANLSATIEDAFLKALKTGSPSILEQMKAGQKIIIEIHSKKENES